jgi:hypothetical protein
MTKRAKKKNPAAVALGSRGGKATASIPGQMKRISKKGNEARWGKKEA